MISRERVIRTLNFDNPDKIPVDIWCMPSAIYKYGQPLVDALNTYSVDIVTPDYKDHIMGEKQLEPGVFKDGWRCVWLNLKKGIIGEVKEHPLSDYSRLKNYKAPLELLQLGWENVDESIRENRDKFILTPWSVNIFERMQFLRDTAELFMDLMEDSK